MSYVKEYKKATFVQHLSLGLSCFCRCVLSFVIFHLYVLYFSNPLSVDPLHVLVFSLCLPLFVFIPLTVPHGDGRMLPSPW